MHIKKNPINKVVEVSAKQLSHIIKGQSYTRLAVVVGFKKLTKIDNNLLKIIGEVSKESLFPITYVRFPIFDSEKGEWIYKGVKRIMEVKYKLSEFPGVLAWNYHGNGEIQRAFTSEGEQLKRELTAFFY